MKFLLLILGLGLVALLLGFKSARPRMPRGKTEMPGAEAAKPGAQEIVACAECGLHLPVDEALPGRGGYFCSAAHRTAHEARHPS
jgi:uncharacterized protein